MRTRFDARPGHFYGLPLGNADGGPFAIRALAATGREEDVETHTHADAHFVLVLSGRYISSASLGQQPSAPPALVFNPPGVTHRDRFLNGIGNFVTVSFSATTFRETAARQPLAQAATQLSHPDALTAAFDVTREICSGRDFAVLESSAWELLATAGRSLETAAMASPRWAQRAYEVIMDSAFRPDLRIGAVAAEIGIHPVHLARVFRKMWGCSPGELLRWRRTERAAELLRGTALTAAEIAHEAGFVDQSHLAHAIRRRIGLTPAAYRRVFRGYKTAHAPRG